MILNRATIILNGAIPVDPFWVDKPLESVIGDYDEDGIPDLMVKFNRARVINYVFNQNITYGNVTLTVTGELYSGTQFEGSDMITAIMPSDVNCEGCVDLTPSTNYVLQLCCCEPYCEFGFGVHKSLIGVQALPIHKTE